MTTDTPRADESPLERLLHVQERDIAIAQLEHRRANLPRVPNARRCSPRPRASCRRTASSPCAGAAIETAERRIDDEVALQREKVNEVDAKLYSGSVVSPRELQALQADLDSLRAHVAKLEDDELEQMQLREEVEGASRPSRVAWPSCSTPSNAPTRRSSKVSTRSTR